MSEQTDKALAALKRIDDAQDIPAGVEVGEVFVEEVRAIRTALERRREPEWIGADGVIVERLRQLTGFEGEASICGVLDELEKLHQRRAPEDRAPWHDLLLSEWSIVGMNHYHVNGERHLFVALCKDGYCIKEEGRDDEYLWNRLWHKANASPAAP